MFFKKDKNNDDDKKKRENLDKRESRNYRDDRENRDARGGRDAGKNRNDGADSRYQDEKEEKDEKVSKFSSKNKIIFIFVLTFITVFIIVITLAQIMTPNVDVEIGNPAESEVQKEQKDEEEIEKMIDERLKWIQFEDNNILEDEKSEETNFKDGSDSMGGKENQLEPSNAPEVKPQNIMQDAPTVRIGLEEKSSSSQVMNKVYIGTYATIEQAMAAQSQILDSDLGISPNIKGLGGHFTLQAGAFANRDKAEELAKKLSEHGIGCRIVQE